MSNPGITHMFHANIVVRDIARSIKWYTEVLGATLIEGPHEAEGPDLRGISFGLEGTGVGVDEVKIAFAVVGWSDKADQTYLDLVEPINPTAIGEVHPSVLHTGLARVCLATEGVTATRDALAERGVEFLTPISAFSATEGPLQGYACVCFRDPDGTVIELFGPS